MFLAELEGRRPKLTEQAMTDLINERAKELYGEDAYTIIRQQISYDRKDLRNRKKKITEKVQTELFNLRLGVLVAQLKDAIQQYEISKRAYKETSTKVEALEINARDKRLLESDQVKFLESMKHKLSKVTIYSKDIEGRADVGWMRVIIAIVKEMRELLGENNPKRVELTGKDGKDLSVIVVKPPFDEATDND